MIRGFTLVHTIPKVYLGRLTLGINSPVNRRTTLSVCLICVNLISIYCLEHHRVNSCLHVMPITHPTLKLLDLFDLRNLFLCWLFNLNFYVLEWKILTDFILISILKILFSVFLKSVKAVPKHIAMCAVWLLNCCCYGVPWLLNPKSHWFIIINLILQHWLYILSLKYHFLLSGISNSQIFSF